MKCFIRPDGTLEFIYSDSARGLMEEGQAQVTRASHVEPVKSPESASGVEWQADMSPSGGGLLGPFTTREEALRAEVAWLERHMAGEEAHA